MVSDFTRKDPAIASAFWAFISTAMLLIIAFFSNGSLQRDNQDYLLRIILFLSGSSSAVALNAVFQIDANQNRRKILPEREEIKEIREAIERQRMISQLHVEENRIELKILQEKSSFYNSLLQSGKSGVLALKLAEDPGNLQSVLEEFKKDESPIRKLLQEISQSEDPSSQMSKLLAESNLSDVLADNDEVDLEFHE
jgi:small-conductance mechanosensitive channel